MTAVVVRIAAVKTSLIGLIGNMGGLSGVQCEYAWPGDDKAGPERIFFGFARPVITQAALRAGRRVRNESTDLDLFVQCVKVGGTAEEAEARVVEMAAEVEQCVSDNKHLEGDPVEGLNWVGIEGQGQLANAYNEEGSFAEMAYTIHYDARLT